MEAALLKTGLKDISEEKKPRLLSDNGSCYISKDFEEYLIKNDISHIRGKPFHPQTQGKIERYHRSMKNVVLLDNYYNPVELEDKIRDWVEYYNNERYHESLNNVTPADRYYGREESILKQRKLIKRQTIRKRRMDYRRSLQVEMI